jgi:hypothetical protein
MVQISSLPKNMRSNRKIFGGKKGAKVEQKEDDEEENRVYKMPLGSIKILPGNAKKANIMELIYNAKAEEGFARESFRQTKKIPQFDFKEKKAQIMGKPSKSADQNPYKQISLQF